jgi:putative transposase
LLWGRRVTKANCSEQEGFRLVFASIVFLLVSVLVFFADKGYRGLPHDVLGMTGGYCRLELVGGLAGQKGFVVQKKRWIVERTFAWLSWSRRLSKDYEVTVKSAEAWIDVSAIRITMRKLQKN